MNQSNLDASEAFMKYEQDFGELLGQSNSTSEEVQITVCLLTLLGFGILWFQDVATPFVLVIGCLVACFVVHRITLSLDFLRSTLGVHQKGVHLSLRGKRFSFPYDAVTSIASKHTHHYLNHRYVGSKAEIGFEIESLFRPLRYECDFSRGKASEQVVTLVTEMCGKAVQKRLSSKLQREGELPWPSSLYPNLCLTPEGLRLGESGSQPRVIHYEDIDAWKLEDEDLKIWKKSDAMPCLVISKHTPNFIPLYGLFESICQYARNTDLPSENAAMSKVWQQTFADAHEVH